MISIRYFPYLWLILAMKQFFYNLHWMLPSFPLKFRFIESSIPNLVGMYLSASSTSQQPQEILRQLQVPFLQFILHRWQVIDCINNCLLAIFFISQSLFFSRSHYFYFINSKYLRLCIFYNAILFYPYFIILSIIFF